MTHPYSALPARSFWRSGVYENAELDDIYHPKFAISKTDKIATAGSCFAQHIARHFKARGYAYYDAEPAPSLLPSALHAKYGYGLFSARYGNIYTVRQLLQMLLRAYGKFKPVEDFWQSDERFYDPFRPTVEPDGFACRDEAAASRQDHLARVRRIVQDCSVFVFTLGLTECWQDSRDGAAYPMCPGTAAGTFDGSRHKFVNLGFREIVADLNQVIRIFQVKNPSARLLLTVSPVPLTATASTDHVLTATTYSKSVLRAVAGEVTKQHDHVDYFPSYEIVMSPARAGQSFDRRNLREVTEATVRTVMSVFFGEPCEIVEQADKGKVIPLEDRKMADALDVVCDEAELEQFAGRAAR